MVKGKCKLTWIVFLFCLLIPGTGLANSEILEIDVQAAVTLALENNLDFRLVTLDLQAAKADLERAEIVGDEDMLTEAREELSQVQKKYNQEQQNLVNQVRSAYQELLESETSLANWEKALKRANEQLEIDENKFKAGLLAPLDIRRAENSLINAEINHGNAVVSLETKGMEFKRLLGLDLKQRLVLTERLLLDFLPFDFDLEECYLRALQIDDSVLNAKEELQRAKETVKLAKNPFIPRAELEKAQVAKDKSEIRLQQAKQSLYFRIRADYYNLLNQIQSLQAKERAIELESQTLKAEESKYAAGVLSNVQIVSQQDKLAQLEQEYSTELLQYSLARLRFLQVIGLENDLWSEDDGN